ncbi:Protein fantom [Geodia barretti]|nr:Protein fantom [Geodia barretti]
MERNLEGTRSNQRKLLQEIEQLNNRLKEEQSRSVGLHTRLNSHSVVQGRVAELEQIVTDLQAEREILKNTNDRLMKSAFAEDRGSEYRGQVRALQERIRELEREQVEYLTTTSNAHTSVHHTLSGGREVSEQIEQEVREGSGAYTHIQTQHQQLKDKLLNESPRLAHSGGGFRTARDGGVLNTGPSHTSSDTALDHLVDHQHGKTDIRRELFELRLSTEETAADLEKTRHLLAAQRAVNQDYQKEISALREQMYRLQTHHLPQGVSDPHPEHHNTINAAFSSRADHVETRERAQQMRERAWNEDRHPQRTKTGVANGEGRREGRKEGSKGTVGKQTHPKLSESTTPSVSSTAASERGDPNFTEPTRPHHRPTGNEELDPDRRVLEQSAAGRGSTVGDGGKTEPPAQLTSPPRLQEPANGDGSASRQNPLVHETREGSGDGRVLSEREVVSEEEEEETKEDVSVSSLNHSSSELGTPSTSTPLRPPLPPPPSGGRTQGTLPPPLLPPFSSSISVIAAEAPVSTTEDPSQWETGGGGGFVMMGGGEAGDGDSVSVTVTELSEEDDEDTMFEETLPTESTVSGRTLATPTTPTQPSVRLIGEEDEEESPLVSPSLTSGVSPSVTSLEEEEEEGLLATPRPSHQELPTVPQVREDVDVMSVCIERLSLEPAFSLTARVADISGYFVEFQLLDCDYGDLETPSVPVSPHSSQPVLFNFKKEFHLGPSQKALLTSALSSSTDNPDRKVLFTVVSDPVDQERECEEVGTAELDLSFIHQTGNDIVNQQLQVLSCNEDAELLGLLTVSVSAAHILRNL